MTGLIEIIQRMLRKVASAQVNYLGIVALLIVLFTAFSAVGLTKLTLESDLESMNPNDIPIMVLDNKIDTEFQRFESIVILIELDDEISGESLPQDIRDPRIVEFTQRLQKGLNEEKTIQNVQSVGMLFPNGVPENLEETKKVINAIPGANDFFDKSYELTVVMIEADVGGDSEKINALNDKVNEIIDASSKPGGVKITTTGDAPLGSAIFELLISDSFFTLIFSTIAIFFLIVILEASFKRGLIILFPLLFGLTWTAGTLGWLGIPITIATAGLSAMLLGLGMEYSIFMVSRFSEERKKRDSVGAIKEAVSNVGASLTASGTTTLIGFLALGLSAFPMLRDLGISLAIGIGFMLSATILAAPVVLLLEDKIEKKLKGEKEIKHEQKVREKEAKKLHISQLYRGYGKFVSEKPWFVLFVAIGITILMFVGIGMIQNQDVDFETVLPSDLEAMIAYTNLMDEFGDSSSILIYVSLEPEFSDSDEPKDIRDPRVLEYIDRLSQKGLTIQDVESVESISEIVKGANGGVLPKSINSEREIFESFQVEDIVNDDYSATLIKFTASEDAYDDGEEVARQARELIEETEGLSGVRAQAAGGLVVDSEMDKLNGPDSQKTSMISLAGIVVFLYVLTRKIRDTFLPLMTVVLGIIWTLGLGGFFGVPFNNITTSVITMTIGIGIDFGLQTMTRYNYELKKYDKRKAMEVALENILSPMIITVVAALVGFRAMSFGQLNVMGDLGTMMSFGVAGSMLAAISGVSALIVIFQKDGNNE